MSVTRLDGRRQIVDLGQNINGWVRLSDLGEAGTTITLTHGEWLGPDGDVTMQHLRPDLPFLPEPLPAGQVDQVIAGGEPGEVFEPRRTTHGFRYVRIEGHPAAAHGRPTCAVSSCTPTCAAPAGSPPATSGSTGSTRPRCGACGATPATSPPTARTANAPGGPATGSSTSRTAAFLYDVAGFSTKWLRDVAADQWPDGTVANISPTPRAEGRESPIAFLNGSAGWGDAAVIVPVGALPRLRRRPDPRRAVADHDRLARPRRAHRPHAAPPRPGRPPPRTRFRTRQFLWDAGFHWGEWLVPGDDSADDLGVLHPDRQGRRGHRLLRPQHRAAGRDRPRCSAATPTPSATRSWPSDIRAAWQTEYLDADGRLTPDTQANHVRALAFGLVPDALRAVVAAGWSR